MPPIRVHAAPLLGRVRRRLPQARAAFGLVLAALLTGCGRAPGAALSPRVCLSEICAAGRSSVADETGANPDWIELHNPGSAPVALEGWSLTDNPHQLHKWAFPAVSIPAHGFLLVFASGENRAVPGQPLHTNFRLNPRGEYLGLLPPDALQAVDEFQPRYPRQHPGFTFGLGREFFSTNESAKTMAELPERGYLSTPTPGAPNAERIVGFVDDVRFSQTRGLVSAPFNLTLTCGTPDAEIRFTTDGSTPTPTNGLRYQDPLRLTNSTVIKAIASKPRHAASELRGHTYIFPAGVAVQTGAGLPTFWGTTNGEPVAAAYRLAPVQSAGRPWPDNLADALRALPTLSLSLAPEDLFDADRGIYAHPRETGRDWERTGMAEWFGATDGTDFAVTCGIRVQGGWSRRPEESPKHSFRLLFKQSYGEPALRVPLFGATDPKSFQTLVLRGGNNNGWLHWRSEERRHGDYLRDPWMRDTFRAMGHSSARSRFAHLYLNGLYWGLYNIAERPDAAFAAAHEGGSRGDYDSLKAGKARSGDRAAWDEIMVRLNRGITNATAYDEIARRVDMTNLVDFLILNFYGANDDWDRSSNWYAARSRPDGRLHFFVWDAERSLEEINDNRLAFDDDDSPPHFFQKLRDVPAFRALFAARVQRHLANGGVLTPAAAGERYRRLATQLDPAILGEAARWGDYRRTVHPYKTPPFEQYTPDAHWRPEVKRLLEVYFPARTAAVWGQFHEAGLAPDPVLPSGR